jgi:hypothetical protein
MSARHLLRSTSGASAAEFALVVPLLLILLFAIIDGGRLIWTLNRAEKATQMGVRFAAVTRMIPSSLASYRFPTGTEVGQVTAGVPVPLTVWKGTTCTRTGCTNVDGLGPAPGLNQEAFEDLQARVRALFPEAQGVNISVTYTNVGLGYAGDPYGPDVSPQISLRVSGLRFTPLTTLSLAAFNLPAFSATMTMEDGLGRISN